MEQFTLEEMLMLDTRKTIINIADMLGIKINKSQRKAVIAKRVSQAILALPIHLLHQLPFREVLKLQQMVHARDHAVPENPSYIMDCIEQIGLTDTRVVGKKAVDFIYPDLAEALLPVIDDFVEKASANETKYRREQLILGLLNLYGILSFNELEELSIIYDPGLKIPGLYHAIKDSYLLKSRGVTIDRKWYYISPYMTDPDITWQEISSRSDISLARFTEEKVMDAGIGGAPQPPVTNATGPFRSALSKLDKTEEEINWLTGEYWMLLNNDLDPFNLIQEILDESPQTMESVNLLLSRFNDWVNNLPRWILKGNSSNYVFETFERPKLEERPPQLIMGPKARKAGTTMSQEEFNKIWEDEFQPPKGKIGRNAPCLCGSGRKYKNCCLNSSN